MPEACLVTVISENSPSTKSLTDISTMPDSIKNEKSTNACSNGAKAPCTVYAS
jgi:hypothetical protein